MQTFHEANVCFILVVQTSILLNSWLVIGLRRPKDNKTIQMLLIVFKSCMKVLWSSRWQQNFQLVICICLVFLCTTKTQVNWLRTAFTTGKLLTYCCNKFWRNLEKQNCDNFMAEFHCIWKTHVKLHDNSISCGK